MNREVLPAQLSHNVCVLVAAIAVALLVGGVASVAAVVLSNPVAQRGSTSPVAVGPINYMGAAQFLSYSGGQANWSASHNAATSSDLLTLTRSSGAHLLDSYERLIELSPPFTTSKKIRLVWGWSSAASGACVHRDWCFSGLPLFESICSPPEPCE